MGMRKVTLKTGEVIDVKVKGFNEMLTGLVCFDTAGKQRFFKNQDILTIEYDTYIENISKPGMPYSLKPGKKAPDWVISAINHSPVEAL